MSRLNTAPTKSNQIRLKRDLGMASEGFSLLEQKREILVMELMRMLDRVSEVQAELNERSRKASTSLRLALSRNGYQQMKYVADGISYERKIHTDTHVAAGVRVPELSVEQGELRSQFGFSGTDSLTDMTMQDFLKLTETANQLAELETSVWLLARELKKTQRRVNALEHIFIPNYKETLRFIEEQLEGRELDSFFTMKMVKKRLEGAEEQPADGGGEQ